MLLQNCDYVLSHAAIAFLIFIPAKQGAAIRRINDQTQYSKNAMLTGSKLVKMTSLGVI